MCAGGVTTAAGHPVPHLCRITLVDTPSDIPYFGEMYDGDGGWHWCIDIGHTMGGYLWKLYNDLHLDSSNALFVGGNVLSVRSEVWTRANSFYPNWYYSFSINHPKYDW